MMKNNLKHILFCCGFRCCTSDTPDDLPDCIGEARISFSITEFFSFFLVSVFNVGQLFFIFVSGLQKIALFYTANKNKPFIHSLIHSACRGAFGAAPPVKELWTTQRSSLSGPSHSNRPCHGVRELLSERLARAALLTPSQQHISITWTFSSDHGAIFRTPSNWSN